MCFLFRGFSRDIIIARKIGLYPLGVEQPQAAGI